MAGRSRGLLIRKTAFTIFGMVFLGAVSWALWHYPFPAPQPADRQASQDVRPMDNPPVAAPEAAVQAQAPSLPPAKSQVPDTPSPDAPKASGDTAASAILKAPAAVTPITPVKPSVSSGPARLTTGEAKIKNDRTAAASSRPAAKPSRLVAAPSPGRKKDTPVDAPKSPSKAAAPVRADIRKPSSAAPKASAAAPPAAKQSRAPGASPSTRGDEDLPVRTPQEAGLAIQALVWSTAPEERLVVVNGNILKEGGAIGGASVASIGEDYIVIKQDGSRWKLKFQLK